MKIPWKSLTFERLILPSVLAIWTMGFAVISLGVYFRAWKLADIGVFGDAFGSINCLFSGLAFALLVMTLWQQRADAKQTESQHREALRVQVLMANAEIAKELYIHHREDLQKLRKDGSEIARIKDESPKNMELYELHKSALEASEAYDEMLFEKLFDTMTVLETWEGESPQPNK